MFEAIATGLDFVTTSDVRDIPPEAPSVVLLVFRRGASPIRQLVMFGTIPRTRGGHRALVCPLCGRPKYRLFASKSGLGCGPCTARRSRRQLEYRTRAWRRLGGDLEDVVLRGLRSGRPSSTVPDAIANAADALMTDDRERAAALLRRADDAFKTAVAADADVLGAAPSGVP